MVALAMVVLDRVTPVSPAAPITISVGSIKSVPALPLGAARLIVTWSPIVNLPLALKSTRPALPTAELASMRAPGLTVKLFAAFSRISPPSPVLLAVLSRAFLPSTRFFPAATVIVLGVVPRPRAVSLPDIFCVAGGNDVNGSVADHDAAGAAQALRIDGSGELRGVILVDQVALAHGERRHRRSGRSDGRRPAAATRLRMRILPSGEIGNEPFIRLFTAPPLICPCAPISFSVNSRVGVDTLRLPTLTVPVGPTTNPCGSAK